MSDTSLFRAGAYQVVYGGIDLGQTMAGVSIKPTHHTDLIYVDAAGDTPVDGINRGRTTRLSFTITNPTETGRKLMSAPFDSGAIGSSSFTGSGTGTIGYIGQTLQTLASGFVLTPVAGINSNNKTITIPKATPDGESGGFSLNNKHRTWDCNFILLPCLTTVTYAGVSFAALQEYAEA